MYIDILFKIERVYLNSAINKTWAMPPGIDRKRWTHTDSKFYPSEKQNANKGEIKIKSAMINVCL